MNCYATLFCDWVLSDNGHLEYLFEKRLKPEIGLQHGGFNMSRDRHKELSAMIKDQGLACSIHLPFFGVEPGAADHDKWSKSRDILLQALEIAAWYEPDHLIGHPEYDARIDSRLAVEGRPAPESDRLPGERWLEQSVKAWGEILALSPARLYLENTWDKSPLAILSLLDLLPERAAMCFDLGHWFSVAGGSRLHNLAQWFSRLAGRLGHLHLHDNHGREDQHLGIGRGEINFTELLGLLKNHLLRPTLTLEAHSVDNLSQSLVWLENLSAGSPLVF